MTRANRGVALISALLIAAVVASIAALLVSRQQYAIAGVSQLRRESAAVRLMQMLELSAMELLQLDSQTGPADSLLDLWAKEKMTGNLEGLEGAATLRDAQRLFNLSNLALDPGLGAVSAAVVDGDGQPAAAGAGDLMLRSVCAAAGVSLRGAPQKLGAPPPPLNPQQVATARFVLLLRALEIEPKIVPAILDWLDPDQDTSFPNGAEDDYYSKLNPPYRTADRRFADPSELLKVRGITPAIYAKLRPYVTVLDQPTAINVNTAPPAVLMSLSPAIDAATAKMLVEIRTAQPFMDPASFAANPLFAGRPLLLQGVATSSNTFELRADLSSDGAPVRYLALIRRNNANDYRLVGRERRYGQD